MGAGRPTKAHPESLYAFAHQIYWDFRRLAEGGNRYWFDQKKYKVLSQEIKGDGNLDLPTLDFYKREAITASQTRLKIPGEPGVVERLLEADTPEVIRELCKDAPNWPTSSLGILHFHLTEHAQAFIAAKNDHRFPRSARPSTRLKQFWFIARAVAGAVFGVEVRTAINLVGSKRPEQLFHESRDGKPARRQRKPRRKS